MTNRTNSGEDPERANLAGERCKSVPDGRQRWGRCALGDAQRWSKCSSMYEALESVLLVTTNSGMVKEL
jgi:hypothetical protein